MKSESIIYTKMLEVLLWIFKKVITFPKKQRFVLGQQIQNSALDCLRYIIQAKNASNKTTLALQNLDKLNVELEVLRSLLRIAYEGDFMKSDSLVYIVSQIDEVGKMRGGSGIVLVSYPTGSMTATGGTTYTFGSDTVHKFTGGGTFTVQ